LRIACLVLLSLFALHPQAARAQDEGQPEAQYLRQRWTAQEGFKGSPNTIAQTPDGYLWAGTDQGLYRFDGQEWLPMQPEEKGLGHVDHVIQLTRDGKGTLWIWMEGTRVIQYKDGRFQEAFKTALEERAVTAIGHGGRGDILMSRAGQHIVRIGPAIAEEIGRSPGPIIVSLAETANGRVWLGTRNLGLFYLDGKKPIAVNGIPSDIKVNCLLTAKDGRLWIGTDHGLSLWDGTQVVPKPMPSPLDQAQIRALVEDREGNLWVGTEQGLVRFDGKNAFVMPRGDSAVTSLFSDREGNIWFSDAHGIERLRHKTFIALSETRGFPEGATGPVYADPYGRVWFGMKKGGLYCLKDGHVTRITTAGLASDIVYSIAGSGNDVWLGRQRGGLTHLHAENGTTTEETFHPRGPLYDDVVYSVHVNRDGSVWAGTLTGGAIHVVNGTLTRFAESSGLGSEAVHAIEETADGTMWFATPTRLSSYTRGQWQSFFERDGLPSSEVICLLEDGTGGLWIGTGTGLAHLSGGRITARRREDTLLRGTIVGLAKDQGGSLWVSTTDRVFSVDARMLVEHPATPAKGHIYGASDGLLGRGGVRRNQSLVADAQGHIWLSTKSGLAVVDASIAAATAEPTIAHVETVRVDGTTQTLAPDETLRVQAGRKRIEFTFVGLNFSAPETVRYRYKLDGFDGAWSEAHGQRSAIYTNLSPGPYTFHVTATNREGGWSDREAYVPVTIEPLFWQRIEFRVMCGLAAALIALLLYQLRMHQMAARANLMFEERLAERTRIAQELHDTLLQGFFSASMQLSVVASKMPVESAATIQLNRILEIMGRVLDEGRNAVQGLRTARVSSMWLEDSVRSIFDDMEIGQGDGAQRSIEVSGSPRELRAGIQDEVCRIVQEAAGNAYKHAQATRIAAAIVYSANGLKVQVRDDGLGINPQFLSDGRHGHWGLQGMRERAGKMGAKLQIESTPGKGTVITLSMPGQIAFRRYSDNPVLNRAIEFSRSRGSTKYPLVTTEDSPGKGE
jgi:signal transduction histidine kinase/ligand-binding sensor domain-containing protein